MCYVWETIQELLQYSRWFASFVLFSQTRTATSRILEKPHLHTYETTQTPNNMKQSGANKNKKTQMTSITKKTKQGETKPDVTHKADEATKANRNNNERNKSIRNNTCCELRPLVAGMRIATSSLLLLHMFLTCFISSCSLPRILTRFNGILLKVVWVGLVLHDKTGGKTQTHTFRIPTMDIEEKKSTVETGSF